MFVVRKISRRQVAVVDSIDEVIEDLAHRSFRDPYELSELLVLVPGEALGDVPRRRTSCISQLVAKLEVTRGVRPLQ